MVRPGYKQTEVGVIPEDWDAVPIGEMFTFKNGLNKAKGFFGYGTPIVNYMDVFGRPSLQIADVAGRVDVNSRELASYEVRKGDVFFTRTSETVEEIGVASVMLDEPHKTVFSGFVLRARPSGQSLDDGFKAYCFAPRYFRQQVTSRASYTTRALTNGRSLSAALLARPPLPEQRAIASALSDVDAALAGVLRLIAKKKDLKQAAMQTLLTGQTRLPGFLGDWEVKRLGEVGDIRSGGTPSTAQANLWDGAIPWCTPTDITALAGRKYLSVTSRTISAEGLRTSSAETIPAKSLIMTSRATIGECAINVIPMTTNQGFKNIIPFAGTDIEFLFYLMTTKKQDLIALCGGSTFLEIGKKQLTPFEITMPPTIAEQAAIAAVLSDMDAENAALTAQADKIRLLKQAMMQDLLTGRVRLPLSEVTDA
ncbi:MAG: hypothetical protein C0524_17515 [Rhodobacter sp.]|nr:hypothetical protein [Rhodobacter sp.]